MPRKRATSGTAARLVIVLGVAVTAVLVAVAHRATGAGVPASRTGVAAANQARLSDRELQRIASYESFQRFPYNDEKKNRGNCTIGYGHKLTAQPCTAADRARYPAGVSMDEALALLRSDVKKAVNAVSRCVKVPLSQAQFDSLVDFAFNAGGPAFCNSTLAKLLNQGGYEHVGPQLRRWVHGKGGKVLGGLVRRRGDDAHLFGSLRPPPKDVVNNPGGSPPPPPPPSLPPPPPPPKPKAPCAAGSSGSPTAGCVRFEVDLVQRDLVTPDGRNLGLGAGTITISPGDVTIRCDYGHGCQRSFTADYPIGTHLSLHAVAGNFNAPTGGSEPDSDFIGWGGACSGGDPCSVTLRSAGMSAQAYFGPDSHILTVQVPNPDAGSVQDPNDGIACGSNRSHTYTDCRAQERTNRLVPLQADSNAASSSGGKSYPGYTLESWGGDGCASTANGGTSCIVLMDRDKTITPIWKCTPTEGASCPAGTAAGARTLAFRSKTSGYRGASSQGPISFTVTAGRVVGLRFASICPSDSAAGVLVARSIQLHNGTFTYRNEQFTISGKIGTRGATGAASDVTGDCNSGTLHWRASRAR